MDNTVITSESPAKPTKTKKRKMSPAGRKAIAAAAKARWAANKSASKDLHGSTLTTAEVNAPTFGVGIPSQPAPTSPAVLKLQEQVVDLVSQRHQARTILNEAHRTYLAAQSSFQSAESELKGIEHEAQYLVSLIAQLENRPQQMAGYAPTPVLQMPVMSGSITSEPAQQQSAHLRNSQESFAVGSADELRREVRGMM